MLRQRRLHARPCRACSASSHRLRRRVQVPPCEPWRVRVAGYEQAALLEMTLLETVAAGSARPWWHGCGSRCRPRPRRRSSAAKHSNCAAVTAVSSRWVWCCARASGLIVASCPNAGDARAVAQQLALSTKLSRTLRWRRHRHAVDRSRSSRAAGERHHWRRHCWAGCRAARRHALRKLDCRGGPRAPAGLPSPSS